MATRNARFTIALLLVLAARVEAHHHIGCVYDTSTTSTISGRIVEIAWRMPHVHIRIAVAGDPSGRTAWDLETVNPQGLGRVGVARDTLRVGDALVANAWTASDGSAQAFTRSLTLPDGRTVAFPIAELTCPF